LAEPADPAVFAKVQSCFAEALGLDPSEIAFDARVVGDLNAESLDFLDIAFRLERAFDIRIPRGGVEQESRAGLQEGQVYEENGVLTAFALAELQKAMPEVPPEDFRAGLKVSDIPTLFRVGTFYNLVLRLQAEKTAAG
jgi:acyl carrier protein